MIIHFDPNDVKLKEWIIVVQTFHYVFRFSIFDYHHIETKSETKVSFYIENWFLIWKTKTISKSLVWLVYFEINTHSFASDDHSWPQSHIGNNFGVEVRIFTWITSAIAVAAWLIISFNTLFSSFKFLISIDNWFSSLTKIFVL